MGMDEFVGGSPLRQIKTRPPMIPSCRHADHLTKTSLLQILLTVFPEFAIAGNFIAQMGRSGKTHESMVAINWGVYKTSFCVFHANGRNIRSCVKQFVVRKRRR